MGQPRVNEMEVIFVYITWPLACVVYALQTYYMWSQHGELRFIVSVFAISAPVLAAFEIFNSPGSKLYNPSVALALFTAFRVIWAVHVVLFQYVTSILRLARRMGGALPSIIVYAGAAMQCALLGVGLALLIRLNVEAVWGIFTVAPAQLLALLLYCWFTAQQLRRRTFFLWTSFATVMTFLSITTLLLGVLVRQWPIPVFSAQCILALVDATGTLFRHLLVTRTGGAGQGGGLFARLHNSQHHTAKGCNLLDALPSPRKADDISVDGIV